MEPVMIYRNLNP